MSRREPHPQLRVLGARLKQVRSEAKWTQEALAEAVGITAHSISQYENGKMSLRITSLLHIASRLGVGIGALLDVTLPVPEAEPPPENEEVLRYYRQLGARERNVAIRLVRELVVQYRLDQ